MVYFKENNNFLRFQGGSNIFKWVQHFPGGVQLLIAMETYRTFDFPGGPDPCPGPPLLNPCMTTKPLPCSTPGRF